MPTESPQNSKNENELFARLAQLQSSSQDSEGLGQNWSEQWQKILMMIAHWQIAQDRTENTVQELSQPLTAIANYAEAASQLLNRAENFPREELQRVLGKLADQVTRSGDLLRTIRNGIRQIGIRRQVCDLEQIVTESLARHSRMLQRARVDSAIESNAKQPFVSIDIEQIHLVLNHLVQNAVKALEDCETAERKIQVRLDQINPGFIEVAISNTGPAIAASEVSKLFLPLYTTRPEHLGIGLALCRAIIESHGGKIWLAENHTDRAEFHISLPYTIEEEMSSLS